jgi:hypothetical protein
MDTIEIKTRLKHIRLQLDLLEAELTRLSPEKPLKFKDLEGLWEGKTDFSYEEIKAVEYTMKDFPE